MSEAPETVAGALDEFCVKVPIYDGDAARVELLASYAMVREVAGAVSFKRFLEVMAATGGKTPLDVVNACCPRSKAAAGDGEKWTAKKVVDLLLLFVETATELDTVKELLPFGGFVKAAAPNVYAGKLQPQREKKRKKAASAVTAVTADDLRAQAETGVLTYTQPPTSVGQRIIYTPKNNGRQVKGVVDNFATSGRGAYVSFMDDDGVLYEDVAAEHCNVIVEAVPLRPPAIVEHDYEMPADILTRVLTYLMQYKPVANEELGALLWFKPITLDEQHCAMLSIMNGEHGPYIEPTLVSSQNPDQVIATAPPRDRPFGEYRFATLAGEYRLRVRRAPNSEE